MRKITLALVAFMLVLGMTQCKKEQQPNNTPTADGETVYITMKVTDNGDKHIVYPGTGAVVYSNGDVIYVGNNGKYVGKLTYANGTFSGSITNPSTSDYLHFYFTGGKTPATAPTAGSTTSFTVDISDQSSKLPVLSYGHSTSKYIDGTTAYTCILENQCGLVKFVPATATSNSISVSGMKTTATIDFATPGITPTEATGSVTLYSVSGSEKWAILLPQDQVDNSTISISGFTARISSVPSITSNLYYTTGVNIKMAPEGAMFGKYTINSNGDQVFFSQGNLQYQASSATWRFAENQWDYVGSQSTPLSGQVCGGTVSGSDNYNISSSYSGWIDLFGWGTSGWNNGNYLYHPYDKGRNRYDATGNGYGPYVWDDDLERYIYYDLTGSYANADWGVYNAISNGGNQSNLWRTLTKDEWGYVLNTRTTLSGIRYAKGNVNEVNGIILLPDNWDASVYQLNNTNQPSASHSSNVISVSDWATMEFNGAIFLPITGIRWYSYNTNSGNHDMYVSLNLPSTNSFGHSMKIWGSYWSTSVYIDNVYYQSPYSYAMTFGDNGLDDLWTQARCCGCAVRLVRIAQ